METDATRALFWLAFDAFVARAENIGEQLTS